MVLDLRATSTLENLPKYSLKDKKHLPLWKTKTGNLVQLTLINTILDHFD